MIDFNLFRKIIFKELICFVEFKILGNFECIIRTTCLLFIFVLFENLCMKRSSLFLFGTRAKFVY